MYNKSITNKHYKELEYGTNERVKRTVERDYLKNTT